jgi:hypothetical protein
MEIPSNVKIAGHLVAVKASGRGYVYVGESLADMNSDLRRKLSHGSISEASTQEWQNTMYGLFETALAAERKRLRGTGKK